MSDSEYNSHLEDVYRTYKDGLRHTNALSYEARRYAWRFDGTEYLRACLAASYIAVRSRSTNRFEWSALAIEEGCYKYAVNSLLQSANDDIQIVNEIARILNSQHATLSPSDEHALEDLIESIMSATSSGNLSMLSSDAKQIIDNRDGLGWRLSFDMSGDEKITISDLWLLMKYFFFLPGDAVHYFFLYTASGVTEFLEMDDSYYSGWLSGLFSLFFWYTLLVSISMELYARREKFLAFFQPIIDWIFDHVLRRVSPDRFQHPMPELLREATAWPIDPVLGFLSLRKEHDEAIKLYLTFFERMYWWNFSNLELTAKETANCEALVRHQIEHKLNTFTNSAINSDPLEKEAAIARWREGWLSVTPPHGDADDARSCINELLTEADLLLFGFGKQEYIGDSETKHKN